MNPGNIARQEWIISFMPDRKRPADDFEKASNVPCGGATDATYHAVTGSSGVAFMRVHGTDGRRDFRGTQKQVSQASAKLSGRSVIVRRRILNIRDNRTRQRDRQREDGENFHALLLAKTFFAPNQPSILFSAEERFLVTIIEIITVIAKVITIAISDIGVGIRTTSRRIIFIPTKARTMAKPVFM